MEFIQNLIEFYNVHAALILGSLLAVSEVLGSFDFFKNSSIIQMVVNGVKKLKASKDAEGK